LAKNFVQGAFKVMALRKFLTLTLMALGLTLAFSASVFAQQPGDLDSQEQRQGREGKRRGGRRGGPGFAMRGLRELNLSDAQRQQVRAILDRFAANIQPQREQLMQLREQKRAGNASAGERAKELRAQIHEYEKAMRVEIMGILTQEQRTKMEAMEQERKARRDQMRQRRQSDQPEIQ
jgi:Spy/CpxP family protein refolding chaperone